MRRTGFTLIELLIVVAIIAILAALAVVNFLEATTRAKLTRAQADMRTLLVGLAAYAVDNGNLPRNEPASPVLGQAVFARLTTPVAYLVSVPLDVFSVEGRGDANDPPLRRYGFMDMVQLVELGLVDEDEIWQERYYLVSRAPDGEFAANNFEDGKLFEGAYDYDPTNGTVSGGDLYQSNQGTTGGHVLQNQNN